MLGTRIQGGGRCGSAEDKVKFDAMVEELFGDSNGRDLQRVCRRSAQHGQRVDGDDRYALPLQ